MDSAQKREAHKIIKSMWLGVCIKISLALDQPDINSSKLLIMQNQAWLRRSDIGRAIGHIYNIALEACMVLNGTTYRTKAAKG